MTPFHKTISLIFNPVIMIALFFSIISAYSFSDLETTVIWVIILLISCFAPIAAYYLFLVVRKRVDPDVKNRRVRIRLLKASALGLISAWVVVNFTTEAHALSQVLLSGAIINLLYLIVISLAPFELSVHVGILTVIVLFAALHLSFYYLLVGTPAVLLTAWSRYALRMHTLYELLAGFFASGFIYLLILLVY